MTTLALPERLRFGGTTPPTGSYDLSSYATVVTNLGGFDDLPALRGANPALTGLHGAQFLAKLFDSRKPAAGLLVLPTAADGSTHGSGDKVGARANLDALYAILGKRRELQVLSRLMPDGSTRWGMAEVWSVAGFQSQVGGRVFALLATWEMPDPMWYGEAVVDSSRTVSSSPTTFSLSNAGTQPTRRLLFDFLGPINNPKITNTTTGYWIELPGVSVAGTKHLIIDPYAFTALNDGIDVAGAIAHAGGPELLLFDGGSNSLTVTGSGLSGATRLTTTVYPAYL